MDDHSTTKKCPSCQEKVSFSATKCPYCGKDFRNWFQKHPIISIIIAIFVLPPFLSGLFSSLKAPSLSPEKPEQVNKLKQVSNINPRSYPKEVNEIEISNKKIKIGDSADSVFETLTDKYKVDSPTIEKSKIIHHFQDGKTLFDMTFERNNTGAYYILTKIVIKDNNYQSSTTQEQPPILYQIDYTSGYLATISVPQGTTKNQLKELLNYFHSLNKKGELSKTMRGHTIIDIFDDKKWTTKENYEEITSSGKYCNYIKATYSVDIDGVEKAGISEGNCPEYERVY
ncbi:hypothetical protein COV86_02810 [Candidatus Roizmanbacteria bacterium CG11_big_fil_rev_8_21_14_0_20_35_14]|uniref:UPF0547 domain-containing protein n=1 Tax=Candidatus Roizmanbacteria bacterium CG11_big_fil_rev_8_21_14_0_20_35_14 TaxID=1974855 RepID=A0A2H0KMJ6_9BACT|nr:MAG: hypothetical protein COV86_02810 [Candidatus Roizmanbacteria bacterium CG11_big_fil_rev_8_21_14_0_20_35_14]